MKTKPLSIFLAVLASAIILAGIGNASSNHDPQIAAVSSTPSQYTSTLLSTRPTTTPTITTTPELTVSGPISATSNQTISNLLISNAAYGVSIDCSAGNISNVVIENCVISNTDGFGILLYDESGTHTINNVVLFHDTIINAGTNLDNNGWIAGIDLAEGITGSTFENIYAIDCSVDGSEESAFHEEGYPTIQNIVILDCYADHSGENKPSPTYGFGYLVNGNTVFYGNTAGTHNYAVDVYNEGSYYNYSPCVNLTQGNTVTRINQGNCTGISIYNGSNYEVILYSTDGNPVSQTISVGGNNHQVSFPYYFIQTY